MTHLSRSLNTDAGRAAFTIYAEDSVRMRIRKRWERRREETAEPHRARTMSAKGLPIPIITAQGVRSVREAIEGDGVPPEQSGESASARFLQARAIRAQIYICR